MGIILNKRFPNKQADLLLQSRKDEYGNIEVETKNSKKIILL
jgi:hypothetical protein